MANRAYTICLVTPEYLPDAGGTARAAARLAGFAASHGHCVHVFAPARNSVSPSQGDDGAPSIGVTVHRISVSGGSDRLLQDAIVQVDQQLGFDLFHGFFFQAAHPCLAVARRGERPVVASFRGIDAHWLKQRAGQADIEVLRQAAWVTSVSTDALTAADAYVDIHDRCSFIPNSIECAAERSWRLSPHNAGVVGTVCTFRDKKDIPLLVQAFGRMPRELQHKLLLVGDYLGPEAELVRRKTELVIARHALQQKVGITGLLEHPRIAAQLCGMNVFVVASKHEGLPNALLEAAAHGVPIVASSVDGTKDVFENERNALLIQPGDPDALAAAIARVLTDPLLSEHLSCGGHQLARSLRPEAESAAWLSLYERLIDSRSGQPCAEPST